MSPSSLWRRSNSSRWLILTQYYKPELGAAQTRLSNFARELQRHGIELEVLTGMPNYPAGKIADGYRWKLAMDETIDGVRVHRVPLIPGSGRSSALRLANYVSFTSTSLVSSILRRKPGLVFLESLPLSLGMVTLALKTMYGIPYIFNVPDLQVDVARGLGFVHNERLLSAAQALEDKLAKSAWMVSTVTPGFIEHYVERGVERKRVSFLPNGADTDFLKPQPVSQALLERWPSLKGKKVFLYVGTHAIYHGMDTLLEAAYLLKDNPDIAFLFVGKGPEREHMKQTVAERGMQNVVFGDSPYEESDQLYSIAYASLAALRDIPVAQTMRLAKVMPSLSCGVPMIFAGKGESPELLEANRCGVAVPPEQPAALAEAMVAFANDPDLRQAMSVAARDLAVREYSWSGIVDRWLGEVAELMRSDGWDGRLLPKS